MVLVESVSIYEAHPFFNKLKKMKVELADGFLVWQVLESLPSQFDALKTTYNAQRD